MRFGSKILFDDVTTAFTPRRRYGLTGPNGAGKSTFMKLLTGDLPPQSGEVTRPPKLGVLSQDQYAFDHVRVSDAVIMGNRRLWQALEEREILYTKTDLSEADGMRLGELEGIVGEEDGYTADSDAAILLQGLDIPAMPCTSGPWPSCRGARRSGCSSPRPSSATPTCSCWMSRPTTLTWTPSTGFAIFSFAIPGILIVISHDRHFLNAVCTHIADIDYQTIITYPGGYDDMVLAKTQVRARIEADNAQREKKIAQLSDFIARFSAGTRASQVGSRRKEVERLQTTDLARSNIQRPYIRFKMSRPSGVTVLEFDALAKAQGGRPIVSAFSGEIRRGEKIVLVGRNGQGKTTILKALLSDAPGLPASTADLDSGTLKWGHGVSIGYFPQDHTGAIDKGTTAVEWLHQFAPDLPRQDIRGLLGQMLFSGEEGMKPTEALSGGETARLLLCRILLQKPNVLILDEPTNHLDLEAINALNVALQEFEGTILVVTHDQDLIEEVGTRVWHFEHGEIRDFKGPYEEYAASLPG